MNSVCAISPKTRGLAIALVAASILVVGGMRPAVSWAADADANLPGMPPPPTTQLLPEAVPPWLRSPTPAAAAPARQAAAPSQPKNTAPPPAQAARATPPKSGSSEPPQAVPAATAQAGDATSSQSPLAVVRWSLNATLQHQPDGELQIAATAGRPLYLNLTIEGGQAAVDRLRAGHLAIDVHWARGASSGDAAAPALTTELNVGRAELAAALAAQVQKQGHFEWHLWARKDALTPGQWTVSLSYPDGTPVQCGKAEPQPCRLSVTVS